jgi:hypothetical protein
MNKKNKKKNQYHVLRAAYDKAYNNYITAAAVFSVTQKAKDVAAAAYDKAGAAYNKAIKKETTQ